MMTAIRSISAETARRLAITKQRLAGPRPESVYNVVEDLGCLQLDPISAVERTHLLVTWSRFGKFAPAEIDRLLFEERRLFEYWAHQASIVLTDDYPIHQLMMRQFSTGQSLWGQRVQTFLRDNALLRQHILDTLREKGPMLSRQFEDIADHDWHSGGWTSGRNVSRMLDFLWLSGEIMVAGRKGGQKLWELSERVLPDWARRDDLDEKEVMFQAVQKSLRALGVATARHMQLHYIRNRYRSLPETLKALEQANLITRVKVRGQTADWPGTWYLHTADLPLLDRLEAGDWQPRTVLLSPFDNLICDRDRTELMWDFFFRIEIYVPKEKRQYGYYVLPILHGDRLIGRIDPQMDRKQKCLTINALYAEPDAPADAGKAVASTIRDLADFLGAKNIVYGKQVPPAWKTVMK